MASTQFGAQRTFNGLAPVDFGADGGQYNSYTMDAGATNFTDLGQAGLLQNSVSAAGVPAIGTAGYPEADGVLTYAEISAARMVASNPYQGDAGRTAME